MSRAPSSDCRTILRVRLTPRGGSDRIDGWSEDDQGQVLKVRVAAAPVDGKANTALIVLLAKTLKVRKSAISIISGNTSRIKRIEIIRPPADLKYLLS